MDLLDRHNIKATFFILGWIAEQRPDLVNEVARRGHEIANRGYFHRSICEMSPAEFRLDLSRSRDLLEQASGQRVIGYRVAHQWLRPEDLWALDILAEENYAYDSSIVPVLRNYHSEPWRFTAHQHRYKDKSLWEFPLSTCGIAGFRVPIAGGNYFRQFPHTVVSRLVDRWDRTQDAPFVMYFHVWELDREQARINAVSPLARLRHYRNLDKMAWVLEDYFNKYKFQSVAAHLGIPLGALQAHAGPAVSRPAEISLSSRPMGKTPVTVVVPCHNEELVLPYLSNTMRSVTAKLEAGYDLKFVFVDDASTDGTFGALKQIFGSRPDCTILQHLTNQGVAAAIQTGLRSADTEIVCSLDCDCTYDPHELENMIPLLSDGTDMVTASPYHPRGSVRNVPSWRLALSKSASYLYRRALGSTLFTYTSCFRVYRKSAVSSVNLKQGGFLGVAELTGRLILRGSKIAEYPATLEVRLLGRSKMKTIRTICGHLSLLCVLLAARLFGSPAPKKTQTGEGGVPAPGKVSAAKQTSQLSL